MRSLRFFPLVCLLSLAASCLIGVSGCNRGAKPSKIGKTAPDFKVSDGSNSIQLADYRGTVVLLNFGQLRSASRRRQRWSSFTTIIRVAILAVSIDEDSAHTEPIAFTST